MQRKPVKIVAVGDTSVGKTCLQVTFETNDFPDMFTPRVCDHYATHRTVDGEDYEILLWAPAGLNVFDSVRLLSYCDADCILLCYSVVNRASYENVLLKWYPEIKQNCPNTTIVLVATKSDLRDTVEDAVSSAEGAALQKKVNAARYIECSARTRAGVEEVFLESIKAVHDFEIAQKHKEKCVIL